MPATRELDPERILSYRRSMEKIPGRRQHTLQRRRVDVRQPVVEDRHTHDVATDADDEQEQADEDKQVPGVAVNVAGRVAAAAGPNPAVTSER